MQFKCDTCKFFVYQNGGMNLYPNEPYPHCYCGKGHWEGEGEVEETLFSEDPWKNCEDYDLDE